MKCEHRVASLFVIRLTGLEVQWNRKPSKRALDWRLGDVGLVSCNIVEGPRWSEAVRGGPRWSEVVRGLEGPKLSVLILGGLRTKYVTKPFESPSSLNYFIFRKSKLI